MKLRPDMTVQCQTVKSYAGRWALVAISLQIVCLRMKKEEAGQVKKAFIRRKEKKRKRKPIFWRNVGASLSITVAVNGSFHSELFKVCSYLG